MKVLEGLYYSKEHEWVKVVGENAYIGITQYAAESLGDIVFVELPEVEDDYNKDEIIGAIESVKAASEMHAPISGTIIEVNDKLDDEPQLLNEDPYGNYIAVLKIHNKDELEALMDSESYKQFCEND